MHNTSVLAKLLANYKIAFHISGTIKKMHFARKNSRVVFFTKFQSFVIMFARSVLI